MYPNIIHLHGAYSCVITAELATGMGSLIEAVNILGSLFYGVILGIFLVAFYFKKIGGNAVFIAAITGRIGGDFFFLFRQIQYHRSWLSLVKCVRGIGGDTTERTNPVIHRQGTCKGIAACRRLRLFLGNFCSPGPFPGFSGFYKISNHSQKYNREPTCHHLITG